MVRVALGLALLALASCHRSRPVYEYEEPVTTIRTEREPPAADPGVVSTTTLPARPPVWRKADPQR